MPAVDYAAAWHELIRRLGEKPHWGTRDLHALMAETAANHEVPEELMQRALRLHGGSYSIHLVPEPRADGEGGSPAPHMPEDPGSSHGERSHDEHHHAGEGQRQPARV